ncbi:MAG: membrane dipeptidase [Thermoplasmataceae archaeon]|jgi:membrane dipeptidase
MNFTDLHEDIAYSSQKVDVVDGSEQSSIKLLSRFDSAFILSSIFPFFTSFSLNENKSDKNSIKFEHRNIPDWNVMTEQINFHILLERARKVTLVRRKEDLDETGIKLLLAMEGADVLRLPEDVFLIHSLGVRSFGLSWNYDNKFAASYLSEKDFGLTGSGRKLVSYCKDLGIAVDLSHASLRTIEDVLSTDHGPIFISHGNPDAVFKHARNYSDDVIKAIAREGGIIGITGIRSTLGFGQNIDAFVKHIEHVGDVAGWEHVAIGSDLLGVDSPVEGLEDVSKFQGLVARLGIRADDVLWRNGLNFFRKIL